MPNPFTYLVLFLSLSISGSVLADNSEQDKNQAYLKKLRTDITELQSWLNKAQDDHKQLVGSLRKSDKEVSKVSQQVERLRKTLKEEQARLKKLQGEQKTLRQQQSLQQTTLNDIIRANYRLGQQPQLQVILNQEDQGSLHGI